MNFAIVTRDELVSLERQRVVESRLIHGVAQQDGDRIEARDDRDDELLAICDAESQRVRAALAKLPAGTARAVVSARRTNGDTSVSAVITIAMNDVSIVTTPQYIDEDYKRLARWETGETACPRDVAFVWKNGSGSVLFHEAIGHASESTPSAVTWPDWFHVEIPRASFRASFTDVPLDRMTAVRVTHSFQRASLPQPRVEVFLVGGGRYEPLTDTISMSITIASLVDRDRAIALQPFTIVATRSEIARGLIAAAGEPRRYPGVICSKEGQEAFVASHAPDLITRF